MTKSDIITHMASVAGISKVQAKDALDAYNETVRLALTQSKRMVLPSIGSITVKPRPAREGRNPRTGDKIKIPAGNKFAFSAAKELRESV